MAHANPLPDQRDRLRRVNPLPDLYEPEELTRTEFLDEVFEPHYRDGEHVTFIGPTGSGKTTLAFQMLDKVATPDRPAVVLVMKPKDSTVDDEAKAIGFRKTETWPPTFRRDWRTGFQRKIRGWVFWPRHSLTDIERDDAMLADGFGRVITDCYRRGDHIIFGDEAHAIQNELGLRREMNAVLQRGRSLGCAGWFSTQRPREVTYNMYSQPEHLILFKTPDERDADVYRQIGGVDPKLVAEAVWSLEQYEAVYIGRNKGEDGQATLAIVKGK